MSKLTARGIVTLVISSLLFAFSPSQIAFADGNYWLGDGNTIVVDIDEDMDTDTLSFEDATAWEKAVDGQLTGLSSSDPFNSMGEIHVQVGGGSIQEVYFDDQNNCSPAPSNSEGTVTLSFSTTCTADQVSTYPDLVVTVDVRRNANWFGWTVYVSDPNSTDPISVYVGGGLHGENSRLEYLGNGMWVTSDNSTNAGTDSIVGMRASGASLFSSRADTEWADGSGDAWFKKTLMSLSSTPQTAISLEGFIVGWNTTVDPARDGIFSAARDCAIDLVQQDTSFGTLQAFFTSSTVACSGYTEPEEIFIETAGVVPSSNPQRAIGQKFTFEGQELTKIRSVVCNDLDSNITAQGYDFISIQVPEGLSGQVNCSLNLFSGALNANNAFRVIDGPVARYVKAVKDGKLNLRIYNAVGSKVRVFIDGRERKALIPKTLSTFVQIKGISAGKHQVVIRSSGKKLLEKNFRAR